jgi:hypothetical protein
MKIKNFKKKRKLQKREKFLPPASDEETSEEEVEEVREGRKKRRKSQPSKMVKIKRLYSNKAMHHIFLII